MPEPTTPLTVRQQAVLAVIEDTIRRRGYPPSMREIGDAVGLSSTSSVAHQMDALKRRGYIRTGGRGKSRAIEVVPRPPRITADTAAHVLHEYDHPGRKPNPFTRALIEAIARADATNRTHLADRYPGYVAAVELIETTQDGARQLADIAGVPPAAPLRPVLAGCGEAV